MGRSTCPRAGRSAVLSRVVLRAPAPAGIPGVRGRLAPAPGPLQRARGPYPGARAARLSCLARSLPAGLPASAKSNNSPCVRAPAPPARRPLGPTEGGVEAAGLPAPSRARGLPRVAPGALVAWVATAGVGLWKGQRWLGGILNSFGEGWVLCAFCRRDSLRHKYRGTVGWGWGLGSAVWLLGPQPPARASPHACLVPSTFSFFTELTSCLIVATLGRCPQSRWNCDCRTDAPALPPQPQATHTLLQPTAATPQR